MTWRWIELRMTSATPPVGEYVCWLYANEATLPAAAGWVPGAEIGVRAVWFPAGVQAANPDRRGLSLVCEWGENSLPRSTLSLRGQLVRVDATHYNFSFTNPGPGAPGPADHVKVSLWVRAPLMEVDSGVTRPMNLRFELRGDIVSTPPLMRLHLFELFDEGGEIDGPQPAPPGGSLVERLAARYRITRTKTPAVLELGTLRTSVPNGERFTRTAFFRVPAGAVGIHTLGIDCRAELAQAGGRAVELWPLGVVAFDALASQPDRFDLRAVQTAVNHRAATPVVDRWTLYARCFPTVEKHPANAQSTVLALWRQAVAAYESSLGHVEGGDPGSTVILPPAGASASWLSTYQLQLEQPAFWRASIASCELEKPVELEVTLPRLVDHAGDVIHRTVVIEHTASPESFQTPARRTNELDIVVGIRDVSRLAPRTGKRMRIGSLDSELAGRGPEAQTDADRGFVAVRIRSDAAPAHISRVAAVIDWQIGAFIPAGQDLDAVGVRLAAEQRETALVIPTLESRVERPMILRATESVASDVSHELAFTLHAIAVTADEAKPAKLSLVIIDTEPFLVVRVLAAVQPKDGSEFGNRSPGASWSSSSTSRGFVVLPPQAVGEDTVKRYDELFAPIPPVAYRFGPPTTIRLDARVRGQDFVEAPWNLRRWLTQGLGGMPGVRIDQFFTETFYGLAVHATPGQAKLTEVLARLGTIPAMYKHRLGRLLASRLAVLEPYDHIDARSWASREVSARFRPLRKRADPISPENPAAGAIPPYLPVWDSSGTKPAQWGLRGGVDWSFDDRKELGDAAAGVSNKALLERTRWSALGGFGLTEASFNAERTRILADVYLGRTFHHVLETVGRIAVFWNWAKHIRIYERTTRGPEIRGEKHDPELERKWDGLPGLRKVREVIQVTQTVRPFPEGGAAGREVCGPVIAARFPEEAIDVDPSWGQPALDASGKQVGRTMRLHRRGSSIPAPVIKLGFASATAKDETVWRRIANPEVVRFFSSQRDGDTSDTDAWAATEHVDFALADVPVLVGEENKASSEKQPDAAARAAGFDDFTFELEPGDAPVHMTLGRASGGDAAPAGVRLDNVTLNRRWPANLRLADLPTPVTDEKLGQLLGRWPTLPPVEPLLGAMSAEQAKAEPWDPLIWANQSALPALRSIQKIVDPARRRDALEDVLRPVFGRTRTLQRKVNNEIVTVATTVSSAHAAAQDVARRVHGFLAGFDVDLGVMTAEIIAITAEIVASPGETPDATVARLRAQLERVAAGHAQRLLAWFVRAREIALNALPEPFKLPGVLNDFERQINKALDELAGLVPIVPPLPDPASEVDHNVVAGYDLDAIHQHLFALRRPLEDARDQLDSLVEQLDEWVADAEALLRTKLFGAADEFLHQLVDGVLAQIDTSLQACEALVKGQLEATRVRAMQAIVQLSQQWLTRTGPIVAELEQAFRHVPVLAEVDEAVKLARKLTKAPDFDAVVRDLDKLLALRLPTAPHGGVDAFRALARTTLGVPDAHKLAERAQALGSSGLRVLRAFGHAPVVPGLQLTRDRVAYYFHELGPPVAGALTQLTTLADRVHFTPSKALVASGKEAIGALETMGLHWPSNGLGDVFKPDLSALGQTLLRDLFPRFAGFQLDELFPAFRFPIAQSDRIKIRHGIDAASRQAWVSCDVRIDEKSTTLFDIGLVAIVLTNLELEAHVKADVDSSGAMRRITSAELRADWEVRLAGTMVLALRKTRVKYEDGRLDFHIDPKRVELAKALEFLTDILKQASPSGGSGLSLELVTDGGSLPVGVRAVIGLALPTLTTGLCSVSGLTLRTYVEIAVRSSGFELSAGLGLSSRERPFQLGVLFLSGGGWFDVGLRFAGGQEKRPRARLSIGIAAGANVPFDIGVASGGISCLVDLGVDWQSAGSLSLVLGITLRGELQVLGLISIGLMVRLEATYSGGNLTARGRLVVRVKICWFIKINLDVGFEYKLAGSNKSNEAFGGLETVGDDERWIEEYLAGFQGYGVAT